MCRSGPIFHLPSITNLAGRWHEPIGQWPSGGLSTGEVGAHLLRMAAGQGLTVGGILLGAAKPAHILTPSSTVRRIVNMAAVAAADAVSERA